MTPTEAIPAATLILLREAPSGPPEVLMVGRGAHLRFAANRMVFPGGRVDADDHLIAARPDLLTEGPAIEPDDLAARISAIRETIEEVGLAPAVQGIVDAAMIAAIRTELHAETPFSSIVERLSLRLDPHGLQPFARWRPPHAEGRRRFDTRFYIARAPELGEALADGSESSHCIWGSAHAHLAAEKMIFPTIRNLERVGVSNSVDEAIAFAARYPMDIITPLVSDRDGVEWISIPDNLGYPVTTQLFSELDVVGSINPVTTATPG